MDNDYDQEVFTFIQNLFINFTIRDAYYIFLNLSNFYAKIVQGYFPVVRIYKRGYVSMTFLRSFTLCLRV